MTKLEFILTAIIWVAYGIMVCYQEDWYSKKKLQNWLLSATVLLSPVVALVRALIGVFGPFMTIKDR